MLKLKTKNKVTFLRQFIFFSSNIYENEILKKEVKEIKELPDEALEISKKDLIEAMTLKKNEIQKKSASFF